MITLDIADPSPGRDAQIEHDAQVRNEAIAECQRFLFAQASQVEGALGEARLPLIMVGTYRAAAEQLERLRTG